MSPAEVRFQETLRGLIDSRGFSRKRRDVADGIHVSPSALSQYLSGRATPSFGSLVALADFFDVSLDYLVFGQSRTDQSAIDYGPLARYIDTALADIQSRSASNAALMTRIGALLARRIEEVASEAQAEVALGGLLTDDETLMVEAHSTTVSLVSMNLQYDVIQPDGAEPAAGRFLNVVAENLARHCQYRFLLPARAQLDWRSIVRSYRELLRDLGIRDESMNCCEFRTFDAPVVAGFGVYTVDLVSLGARDGYLAERIRPYLQDGLLGYTLAPSEDLRADAIMNADHVIRARNAFDEMWSSPSTKPL